MVVSLLESREVNDSSRREKQMCISAREREDDSANEVLTCFERIYSV